MRHCSIMYQKERADQIRAQIETTKSDYDREKRQERLGKPAGGMM